MNAVYAALLCVFAALVSAMLRPNRPELATAVSLAAGVAAAAFCLGGVREAAYALNRLTAQADLDGDFLPLLLRAGGITLLCEFAMQLCADAGESALAGRIRLAMRVTLLAMAIPALNEALECAFQLLKI